MALGFTATPFRTTLNFPTSTSGAAWVGSTPLSTGGLVWPKPVAYKITMSPGAAGAAAVRTDPSGSVATAVWTSSSKSAGAAGVSLIGTDGPARPSITNCRFTGTGSNVDGIRQLICVGEA